MTRSMLKPILFGFAAQLLVGCTSYGLIDNGPIEGAIPADSYSIKGGTRGRNTGDISLMLAFSGGGTRAAALAYGVVEELRDTTVVIDGRPRRLIDEIDVISSVSGGGFTSAYFGLHGDRIFDDFEDAFLRRDVQGQLIRGPLNPLQMVQLYRAHRARGEFL